MPKGIMPRAIMSQAHYEPPASHHQPPVPLCWPAKALRDDMVNGKGPGGEEDASGIDLRGGGDEASGMDLLLLATLAEAERPSGGRRRGDVENRGMD